MPDNDPEAEYFARLDREKKAALAETVALEQAAEERQRLKLLHAGRCGRCGGDFQARAFRGVEIDVCGSCNTVLLDPGELEQLAGQDETGVLAPLANFLSAFRKKS